MRITDSAREFFIYVERDSVCGFGYGFRSEMQQMERRADGEGSVNKRHRRESQQNGDAAAAAALRQIFSHATRDEAFTRNPAAEYTRIQQFS